jgi:phosphatidylglycerol:prolipoprotein diacylglycerol transferase
VFPIIEIGPVVFSTFRLSIFLGFFSGILLFRFYFKRDINLKQYTNLWIPVSVAAILGGLSGARLWEALKLADQPIGNPLDVTQGSTWYGGFLTASALDFVILLWFRAPILRFLDLIIPSVCLGQVLGRIGCFCAGDGCFGTPTDLPWGVVLPNASFSVPVHPTPLYEATSYAIVFAILIIVLHRQCDDGVVFALYAILAGGARFAIEFIRVNPRIFYGLTEAQLISAVLVVVGVVVLCTGVKKQLSAKESG